MKKKPVSALAREVIANVTRYIEEREEVINEAQFKEFTALIDGELARIAFPTTEQFESRRPPWVRVMEQALIEIDSGTFHPPYEFNYIGPDKVLYVSIHGLLDHLTRRDWLTMHWDEIPIRSGATLKSELQRAGVVVLNSHSVAATFERQMGRQTQRVNCVNLSKMFRVAYFNPIGLPFH